MTVREAVEMKVNFKDVDFVQVICDDYRKCDMMPRNKFVKLYKGTDTWYENVKDFGYEDTNFYKPTKVVVVL